jgi:hypothetical protein
MLTPKRTLPRRPDIRKFGKSSQEVLTKLTKGNSVSFVSDVSGMDPDFGAIPARLSNGEFRINAALLPDAKGSLPLIRQSAARGRGIKRCGSDLVRARRQAIIRRDTAGPVLTQGAMANRPRGNK